MQNKRNPLREGEVWRQDRIDYQLSEIDKIRDIVTFSGGWAWHFMSPPHKELKVLHDHKDIDVFVDPIDFNELREFLVKNGYERARTRYDDPSGDFYRYVKRYELGKVVYDIFVKTVEFIKVQDYKLVEPGYLLSLYGNKHTTEDCTAVMAARTLLDRNVSPVLRPELVGNN